MSHRLYVSLVAVVDHPLGWLVSEEIEDPGQMILFRYVCLGEVCDQWFFDGKKFYHGSKFVELSEWIGPEQVPEKETRLKILRAIGTYVHQNHLHEL